jgi:aspartate/methionine/tyrosine aminotransferase
MTISNSYFFQAYVLPNSVAVRWISQSYTSILLRASASAKRYCSSISSDDVEIPPEGNVNTLSSARGRAAVGLLPTYLADARSVARYSPNTNPSGALQLGVAESKMLEDWLLPILNMDSPITIPADAIYYQPTSGRDDLKKSLASYIEDLCDLGSGRIRQEGLIVGAGCNAVLENLCMTLADVGDGVLVPTPYYAAFEFDLVARAGLQVHPVTTEAYHPNRSKSYLDCDGHIDPSIYYPNFAALNAAYERSKDKGCQPRILLISHPMNPLGICYPAETILECIEWCRNHKIHFICDEIYAGSVYQNGDDNTKKFKSSLSLAGRELGPYVHWVYALSKDFALSGLRIGAAYTENPEIILPMQKLNDLCQISSQTQLWTADMLQKRTSSDDQELWTTSFRKENHKRLLKRYSALTTILDRYKIPYLPAEAGLFVWIDLSQFLSDEGNPAVRERSLYLELIDFGLLLTPGNSMRNERPGFFRFVFTAASEDEFTVALHRIDSFFRGKCIQTPV